MRNSLLQKTRRRLFMERLESRYALDGDGLDDPIAPPPDPPPSDPPPAETGSGGDSGAGDTSGDPSDTPPPDPNSDPPSDPPSDETPPSDPPPSDPPADDPPPDTDCDGNPGPAVVPPSNPPPTEDPTPTGPLPPPPEYPNLPGPDASAEDLMGLTDEEFNAWLVKYNWIDGGYIGYANPSGGSVPQQSNITPPINGDAAQELTDLATIFDAALSQYRRDGNVTGMGWWGNVSRQGPECDAVFEGITRYINMQMTPNAPYGYRNETFDNYTFATITAGGMLSLTGLTDHVYFGIVNKTTGQLEYFMDPWRNTMFDTMNPAGNDPNWNVISVEPWTYAPPPPPPPTPDPLPPGDWDGKWTF